MVSPEFIGWIAAAFASITGSLLAVVWKKHGQEIKEIKDTAERNRKELKDSIILVYSKLEAADVRAQARHDDVVRMIVNSKSQG